MYVGTSVEQYEALFNSPFVSTYSTVQTEDFAEHYTHRMLDLSYEFISDDERVFLNFQDQNNSAILLKDDIVRVSFNDYSFDTSSITLNEVFVETDSELQEDHLCEYPKYYFSALL